MIPIFKPIEVERRYQKKSLRQIKKVVNSGVFIKGSSVTNFEKKLSAYLSTEEVLGVNSGTDAIRLGLISLNVGKDDEVIVPSHTATATISAIISVGAIPVFVDIEENTYLVDLTEASRLITKKTKALIFVHIYGKTGNMLTLLNFCQENNIYLIEDCAQAFGAEFQGQKIGTFGDVGCYSFYPTKNLGAIGDAGAVVSKHPDIMKDLREISQYGWDQNRISVSDGFNSRLDEIQAAVLLEKLNFIDEWNSRRIEIANKYSSELSMSFFEKPRSGAHFSHVFHLYVVRIDSINRESLIKYARQRGVQLSIHYKIPNHLHPNFKRFQRGNNLSNTEIICKEIISIPIYPNLRIKEINHVCAVLNDF